MSAAATIRTSALGTVGPDATDDGGEVGEHADRADQRQRGVRAQRVGRTLAAAQVERHRVLQVGRQQADREPRTR